MPITRGDIRVVDLEPVRGSEADKSRPAVVLSNNSSNMAAERLNRGVITIVPLTTNTSRILNFQVLLPPERTGLHRESKVQAEQIRSVSIDRIGALIGIVPVDLLDQIGAAVQIHLGLD